MTDPLSVSQSHRRTQSDSDGKHLSGPQFDSTERSLFGCTEEARSSAGRKAKFTDELGLVRGFLVTHLDTPPNFEGLYLEIG